MTVAVRTASRARLVALVRDIPRHPGGIAYARRQLERLGEDLTRAQLADLQLVVTELVTNALLHGRGGIRLEVTLGGGALRGHVVDQGGGFRVRGGARGPDETSGRGLGIVEALSTAWGIEDGRSLVWFEIDAAPRAAR